MQIVFYMPPKRDTEISMATAIHDFLVKHNILAVHKIVSITELSDKSILFIAERIETT